MEVKCKACGKEMTSAGILGDGVQVFDNDGEMVAERSVELKECQDDHTLAIA